MPAACCFPSAKRLWSVEGLSQMLPPHLQPVPCSPGDHARVLQQSSDRSKVSLALASENPLRVDMSVVWPEQLQIYVIFFYVEIINKNEGKED